MNKECILCSTIGIDEWLKSRELDCNLHRSCLEYNINNQEEPNEELLLLMNEFGYGE